MAEDQAAMDEKKRLEDQYGEGKVWTMQEARELFEFKSFGGGFVMVVRKSDGARGSLDFDHSPRFYYDFQPT